MKAIVESLSAAAAALVMSVLFSGCCTCPKAADSATPPATTTIAPAIPPTTTTATPAAPVKINLKMVRVDSEETAGENGAGANAVDGDPATFWHTQWQDATPECPHEIIVELVPPSSIKGFTQLPRQDDNDHGNVKDYEFYVSDYSTDFGQPVKKGSFEAGPEKKTVTFAPVKGRFIKLKALSEVNGEAWTSIAELNVIPAD